MDTIMNTIDTRANVLIEEIRFGFGDCSLGAVLVAISVNGVVAILMGDTREALRVELTGAFPDARLAHDQAGVDAIVVRVVAFLDAPCGQLDLPLDIRGSAIEQEVWRALRAIPAGQTTTYGQIAKALPVPATAQEVGAACAGNLLAVAIPCHRVVKADGSISGYRWGVGRKRKLLNRETPALRLSN
jgi:AraC family transcriptional regulator, regulatory protein of adaptative response / methylated-DNA-[protein]-cysteine methyltransferase